MSGFFLGKKPLACVVPDCTNSESAVMALYAERDPARTYTRDDKAAMALKWSFFS